jgi:trigger factor
VVEANTLRATEAELDARVAELAASRGVPAGQLYGNLQKANRLPELERGITEEKAFAWLLQQSTIDEVKS